MLGEHKLSSPSTRLKVNHLCIRYLCFESVRGDFLEGHSYASHATYPSSRAQKCQFCARGGGFCSSERKLVLRQISCYQVKQVWKILIQRSRSEARPYILLLIYFILLFRPSISPLLIEYFMAFLMGEMSRWTLFTKLTTSP